MTPSQFEKVQAIYRDARSLEPSARRAFLDAACAHDDGLREEVESLLRVGDDIGSSFLKRPALGSAFDLTGDALSEAQELSNLTRIGQYDIVRPVGFGGMGVVYEAEQENPHRTVALKLIRPGLASSQMLLRFKHEAHVLAYLRHPGVAQVYEAGWHPTSLGKLPFIAMEFIDGPPLLEYVDRECLSLGARLSLFTEVCKAVHHAHQKGVIHRDLKPGNILIDSSGDTVQPKIMDFGIARIMNRDLLLTTLHTEVGQLMGTMQYMSPEQLEGKPEKIDVRSDVYALGVILYELLTGSLPYRVHSGGMLEYARIVCEEQPQSPSVLNPELRGDLETIVLKPLEKAPSRRYQSTMALAEDVDRYLTNRTILARRPTITYRLVKLVKRRKGLVALAAAMLIGVVTVGVRSSIQRAKVERAVRSSEQFYLKLVDIAAASFKPTFRGEEVRTWRGRLDELAKRIDAEMSDYPEGEAALRTRLGVTYGYIADYNSAKVQFTRALDILRKLHDADHPDVAMCLRELGSAMQTQGRHTEAEPLLRESLAMYRRLFGPIHPEVVLSQVYVGSVFQYRVQYQEAEKLYRGALALSRQLTGDQQEHEAICLFYLARVLNSQNKIDEAEECIRKSIEIDQESGRNLYLRPAVRRNSHYGPNLSSLGGMIDHKLSLLSSIRYGRGDLEGAKSYAAQTVAMRRRWYASGNPELSQAIVGLAGCSWAHGDYETAETMIREAVDSFDKNAHESLSYLICLNSLGVVLRDREKFDEGEAVLRRVLTLTKRYRKSLTANALINLGKLLYAKGDRDAAAPLLQECLDLRKSLLPEDHIDISEPLISLGLAAMSRSNHDESESLIREALRIRRKGLPEDHWLYGEALSVMGACLSARLQYDEAEPLLLDGYRILTAKLLMKHKLVVQSVNRLVEHYEARGLSDRAASFRAKLTASDGLEDDRFGAADSTSEDGLVGDGR